MPVKWDYHFNSLNDFWLPKSEEGKQEACSDWTASVLECYVNSTTAIVIKYRILIIKLLKSTALKSLLSVKYLTYAEIWAIWN